jgi:hypothetical protein
MMVAAAWPQAAGAQVFLAASANPSFGVGPLLVTATITDAVAAHTPIRIVWGIVPAAGSPGSMETSSSSGRGRSQASMRSRPNPLSSPRWSGGHTPADISRCPPGHGQSRLGLHGRARRGRTFVTFERQSNLTGVAAGSLIRIRGARSSVSAIASSFSS